jgi:hypothetical protein
LARLCVLLAKQTVIRRTERRLSKFDGGVESQYRKKDPVLVAHNERRVVCEKGKQEGDRVRASNQEERPIATPEPAKLAKTTLDNGLASSRL